ncbi:unnamed protein product [Lota lota]
MEDEVSSPATATGNRLRLAAPGVSLQHPDQPPRGKWGKALSPWKRVAYRELFRALREQGLVAERECTRVRDSACTVSDGFYCQEPNPESGCTLAQIHTQCTPGQMTKVPGTRTTDTVCENCETGFYSPDGINCTQWNM